MILETIKQTGDIKKVSPKNYERLAEEIRAFLLEKISRTGGHLASNLGAVELTMALHIALDLPKDKLIFDVGHQCYTHKLLSGRREGFDTLRQYGGMSGFQKKCESDCDLFDLGHSSTSLSMGLGLVTARDQKKEDYAVVSVIGDGSLTGGMAFEALNNASRLRSNYIIILNDNNMSIARNVGGISRALKNLRTAPRYNALKQNVKAALDKIPAVGGKMIRGISQAKNSLKQLVIPGMVFEDMDLTYLGPFDGHNVQELVRAIKTARRLDRAVVVHVVTKKGKGYLPAEKDPELFHGVGPFDAKSGKLTEGSSVSYTEIISEGLCELAEKDHAVTAVTAAMPMGTGLSSFAKKFPDRLTDVGIAEQHAVSFASGQAAGGLKPYVCIYSTFLQRAYDQILHDVCLQKANVKFLIDRAGLVGADGETHQGMFDAGFLQTAPELVLMAPKDGAELKSMLDFSLTYEGPLAIRYPRGCAAELHYPTVPLELGKAEVLEQGEDILLFAAGSMVTEALKTAELLKRQGMKPTVVNARFMKPFDKAYLAEAASSHRLIAVLEENNRSGALGEHIADYSFETGLKWIVLNTAPDDGFVPQGRPDELLRLLKLDAENIAQRIMEEIKQ